MNMDNNSSLKDPCCRFPTELNSIKEDANVILCHNDSGYERISLGVQCLDSSTTVTREDESPRSNAMFATKASCRKLSKSISNFIATETVGVTTNLYREYSPPQNFTVRVRFCGFGADAPAWSLKAG